MKVKELPMLNNVYLYLYLLKAILTRLPLCSMWICHQQLSICNPKILKSEVLQLKSLLDSISLRKYFFSSKVMAQFFFNFTEESNSNPNNLFFKILVPFISSDRT